MIKYLFKYVMKGHDRSKIYFETTAANGNMSSNHDLAPPDEILEYMDARFLSTCEALHRIYEFDIHYRVPPVERLAVHLLGMNYVRYETGSDLRALLNSPAAKRTMLTEWFEKNAKDEDARSLTTVIFQQNGHGIPHRDLGTKEHQLLKLVECIMFIQLLVNYTTYECC